MSSADSRDGDDSARDRSTERAHRDRDRLLAALLAIDPDLARAIRAGTARPRPRPQVGPSADHGD